MEQLIFPLCIAGEGKRQSVSDKEYHFMFRHLSKCYYLFVEGVLDNLMKDKFSYLKNSKKICNVFNLIFHQNELVKLTTFLN